MHALVVLRDNVGPDAVYIDLPEDQQKAFDEAKDREGNTAIKKFQFLPNNAVAWASAGIALATALTTLYMYD